MRALTAIGEVGIEAEGRSYLLRPSLFSMTQIGTPAEIVETTALLLATEPDNPYLLKRFRKERFERALTVVYACSGDQDTGALFGGLVPTGRGRIAYSAGLMPMGDILAIAQGLIRHGIMGDVEPEPGRVGEPMTEFKAAEYVAAAIAHLGMTESDAWNLTMTSFVQVMRSKYPPKPGVKPMTAGDVDATLARLERINAARAGKK